MDHLAKLDAFRKEHGVKGKGNLSVVIQLTRAFSRDELPIDADDYVTGNRGQVAGLGAGNLKKILADHGIARQLAKEAGRTSRGSMKLMYAYVDLVNSMEEPIPFGAMEEYWACQVKDFFANQPFKLSGDSSRSVTSAVDDLLAQASARQAENPGMKYAGTVLQHLVAAKLELLMPDIEIHSASDADDQTGRVGDFLIEDTAIHCTTAPASLLIEKCRQNIDVGMNPVIITISSRLATARGLLEDAGMGSRVEVWDVQQFLSTNAHEHASFDSSRRKSFIARLIESYNGIIDDYETDPSLKIDYNA